MTSKRTKPCRYGYLDKVLSVTEGRERRVFTYHADGQLATAARAGGPRPGAAEAGGAQLVATAAETETFLWDGLALIRRGSVSYVNEPHPGGGSPILSSRDGVMFNDVLGTTLGADGPDGYDPAATTAFGDSIDKNMFFTGKPRVDGLGYAFLFRNYRPELGKWQTADPLGYPDGWNRLAYCGNGVVDAIDCLGGWVESVHHDINQYWLTGNGYNPTAYDWGGYSINVLSKMNAASDWTDSILAGNQTDARAYLHAMRSSKGQSFQEAATAYYRYLSMCARYARQFAVAARNAYARYEDSLAVSLLYYAIEYVGRIVHTFSDSFSPSHAGFQYFSLWNTPSHISQETMAVYTANDGYWQTTIFNELNKDYEAMLRYVLKQPHRGE